MIYLVLAIIILYLFSLSIAFGVKVDINTDIGVGKAVVRLFFIPIFKKKINIKRLLYRSNIQTAQSQDNEEKEEQESDKPSAFKKFLIDCAIKILKAVRVKNASLQSKIGTGDAAADGMAVGMLRIMYTQFCAFFGFDGSGAVIEPDYNVEILLFDFFGIFSISFADIIFAVFCVVFERISHYGGRRSYANVTE